MVTGYMSIPAELRSKSRWCIWVKKVEGGRVRKIPVDANTGMGASADDPDTWCSFEDALQAKKNLPADGIGFFLGDGYVGIDIENALPEAGALVQGFVENLRTYAEYDSAGNGVHIIFKGSIPKGKRQNGNISFYDGGKYFAITGNRLEYAPNTINNSAEEATKLYNHYIQPKTAPAFVFDKSLGMTLSDDELIDKASSAMGGDKFTLLFNGAWEGVCASKPQADEMLASYLAFWTRRNPDQMDRLFRRSKLMTEKWDYIPEEGDGKTYGETVVYRAMMKCKEVYGLTFNPNTQIYNPNDGEIRSGSKYQANDTGNAQRFVERCGKGIRYNFDNNCWYYWDGTQWSRDVAQIVKAKADAMIADMRSELFLEKKLKNQTDMLRNISRVSSNAGKNAMLAEAQHLPTIPVHNSDFDREEDFINCENGIISLRDGSISPHDRYRFMSKKTACACDMEHEPKRWLRFLDEVFQGAEDMIDYIQRAVGYTLTGSTREQCIFQCYGDGANGKSVFLDMLYNLLGNYACNVQIDSILAQNANAGRANSEIARMAGARFVRTNEPNEGARLNEGLVKQLSSGDPTTARFLYGNEFEFKPKFKIWIASNYRLTIRGTDGGIWRRMRLIPFNAKFEGSKADKNLPDKLAQEMPQILGWAVKGAIKYYKDGLTTPGKVEKANDDYRHDMDVFGRFLEDCTEANESRCTSAMDLYRTYYKWSREHNEFIITSTKFNSEMGKRFTKIKLGAKTAFQGVALIEGLTFDKGDYYGR